MVMVRNWVWSCMYRAGGVQQRGVHGMQLAILPSCQLQRKIAFGATCARYVPDQPVVKNNPPNLDCPLYPPAVPPNMPPKGLLVAGAAAALPNRPPPLAAPNAGVAPNGDGAGELAAPKPLPNNPPEATGAEAAAGAPKGLAACVAAAPNPLAAWPPKPVAVGAGVPNGEGAAPKAEPEGFAPKSEGLLPAAGVPKPAGGHWMERVMCWQKVI